MNKKKHKPLTLPSMICLTAALVCLLVGCGSGNSQFEQYVKNGDYGDAIDCYQENIEGNTRDEQEAADFLATYLNEKLDAYADGSLSETDFSVIYNTVAKIEAELYLIEDEFWTVDNSYSWIADSKYNYQIAQEYLAEGDTFGAISSLSYVVEEDIEHYDDAQEQLAQVLQQYEEEQLAEYDVLVETYVDNSSSIEASDELYAQWEERVLEAANLGVSYPETQETCSRLISHYWYLATGTSTTPSSSELEEYTREAEYQVRNISEEFFGYDSALDWVEIEFTDEIQARYNWVYTAIGRE